MKIFARSAIGLLSATLEPFVVAEAAGEGAGLIKARVLPGVRSIATGNGQDRRLTTKLLNREDMLVSARKLQGTEIDLLGLDPSSFTASSRYDYRYPASNAFDGNLQNNSRWISNDGEPAPAWVQVDLASTYDINQVNITWDFWPASYEIQVSSDGTNFTTALGPSTCASLDDCNSKANTFNASGRYVRMYASAFGGGKNFVGIWEMEVYGTSAASSPTTSTASSPATNTPWDIELKDVEANFTSTSEEELKILYTVGRGRDIEHELLAGGCEDPFAITGLTKDVDYTVTNSTTTGEGGLDFFQLAYSFDKAKIAQSNIWNQATKAIVLCQILRLTLDDGSGGFSMVISEVKSNVTIDFDLTAVFSLENVDLDGATILANNENTTLDDYISAYKCDDVGVKSEGENLKLVPNEELRVCVQSSSSDVQIESIDFMKIDGTNPTTGPGQELIVMEGGAPKFDAITSFTILNEDPEPVGMVITRIPPSLFDYEATDATIDVSGFITVKLAGTQRKLMLGDSKRVLQAGEAANLFDTNANDAAFDVVVDLQPEENVDEFDGAMMSSANAINGKVLIFVGIAVVSAFALW